MIDRKTNPQRYDNRIFYKEFKLFIKDYDDPDEELKEKIKFNLQKNQNISKLIKVSQLNNELEIIEKSKVARHILNYIALINDLKKEYEGEIRTFGEDFSLSSVAFVLGLSDVFSNQLKDDAQFGTIWPGEYSLCIDNNGANSIINAISEYEKKSQWAAEKDKNGLIKSETIRLNIELIDSEMFRMMTAPKPDYSNLPFPIIEPETIHDFVQDEGKCFSLYLKDKSGNDESFAIDEILKVYPPKSLFELEQISGLFVGTGYRMALKVPKEEWFPLTTRQELENFFISFGLDQCQSESLVSKAKKRELKSEDIELLKSHGINERFISNLTNKIHLILSRYYSIITARLILIHQFERNALNDLNTFCPIERSEEDEQKLLDRLPDSEKSISALKEYIRCHDGSFQAKEKLAEIREKLTLKNNMFKSSVGYCAIERLLNEIFDNNWETEYFADAVVKLLEENKDKAIFKVQEFAGEKLPYLEGKELLQYVYEAAAFFVRKNTSIISEITEDQAVDNNDNVTLLILKDVTDEEYSVAVRDPEYLIVPDSSDDYQARRYLPANYIRVRNKTFQITGVIHFDSIQEAIDHISLRRLGLSRIDDPIEFLKNSWDRHTDPDSQNGYIALKLYKID